MSKVRSYKVRVRHVQRFENVFLVKAPSAKAAREKFLENWNRAEYAYEKTTDCPDDTDTAVTCLGPAAEGDENLYYKIDDEI